MKKALTIPALLTTILIPVANADEAPVNVSFGVALHPSTWQGENTGGSDYDQTATQLQLSMRVRKGNFYGGLSFQGAEYDFENGSPDIVRENTSTSNENARIKRGESDLVFGYFFWPQVSLFVDFKRIYNNWEDSSYSVAYRGMGLGVSGFNPINDQWVLFGSLGFIRLDIVSDDDSIGDGDGSALVVGALYKLTPQANFTISLKSQSNKLDFDEGSEQENTIGGLVFGFNYSI